MSFVELFAIALALSMDAFSVAVCKGLAMKKINYKHSFIIAGFFGGFQALMPLIGWLLGRQFEKYIVENDHWIAFVLLGFIGGKMLYDTFKGEEEKFEETSSIDLKETALMAVATSIDALAVGVTFAFLLKGGEIVPAIAMIGIITFVLSSLGIIIGNFFGSKYKRTAQIFGGVILILMGIKILLEHLEIINFNCYFRQ